MTAARGRFDDFEQVAEAGEVYTAELMALNLREAGIDAQVVDQTYYQEPLPSVRAFSVVRVLVPTADAARARDLLAAPVGLPEDAEQAPAPTDDAG